MVLVTAAAAGTATLANAAGNDSAASASSTSPGILEVRSIDGSGNNKANPTWGKANTNYLRVGAANYADGKSKPVSGPNTRAISNRIINDVAQDVFSEHDVSQFVNVWGQFLDHTFGLAQGGGESAPIAFNSNDPLESFRNDLGVIGFTRDIAAPNTGVNNPRQQVNRVSSFIEASAVYGDSTARLEWLRDGSVDGNVNNNKATLLLPGGFLPRRDARGNPGAAPETAIDGRLVNDPNSAVVAGDFRANENIALTAMHTLFAREHNRIVGLLPRSLSETAKFEVARRVVGAEQQWITYNAFLPAVGVNLPAYQGYKSNVNPTLGNEFATVGYRAHSQIHGEIEIDALAADFSQAQRDALVAKGVEIEPGEEADEIIIVVPLGVAFFNPTLVQMISVGRIMKAEQGEAGYNNDEMIDNQLRSVLFQIPTSANPECLNGPTTPECFHGVSDLGAIDIERGRDHGMPSYNAMRQAYGLPAQTSFTGITGEATDAFPSDPLINANDPINDPNILDFTELFDINGNALVVGSEAGNSTATRSVRRTTTAARLKAIYGSVNNVDAFTGMIAEKHVSGSEFGELQRAIWTKQFAALRDGDRWFYANDAGLTTIRNLFGIDFRTNLGDVVARNTSIPRADLAADVFHVNHD